MFLHQTVRIRFHSNRSADYLVSINMIFCHKINLHIYSWTVKLALLFMLLCAYMYIYIYASVFFLSRKGYFSKFILVHVQYSIFDGTVGKLYRICFKFCTHHNHDHQSDVMTVHHVHWSNIDHLYKKNTCTCHVTMHTCTSILVAMIID